LIAEINDPELLTELIHEKGTSFWKSVQDEKGNYEVVHFSGNRVIHFQGPKTEPSGANTAKKQTAATSPSSQPSPTSWKPSKNAAGRSNRSRFSKAPKGLRFKRTCENAPLPQRTVLQTSLVPDIEETYFSSIIEENPPLRNGLTIFFIVTTVYLSKRKIRS